MDKFCRINLYLILLLFIKYAFLIGNIEEVASAYPILEYVDNIVYSHDKSYFRKILFIFDLNKTLLIPKDYFLEYSFNHKFSSVFEEIYKEEGGVSEREILRSIILNLAPKRISDDNFLNLLNMIKTDEFKAIAITESEVGRWGVIENIEDFMISKLASFDVKFNYLCSAFKSMEPFFNGQKETPLLKKGILFYRNMPLAHITRWLLEALYNIVKWQPKRIIFINSSKRDLELAEKGLAVWNQQSGQNIKFKGFYYFPNKPKFNKKLVKNKLKIFFSTGEWGDVFSTRAMPDDTITPSQKK